MQVRLLRRSDLRPTRTSGVFGQKCRTSGYHCDGLDVFEKVRHTAYLVHDILE